MFFDAGILGSRRLRHLPGAIVWKVGGFKAMTAALDPRGKRIRAELDEAQAPARGSGRGPGRLSSAAASEAEREADAIVASARDEAERTAKEAHERMTDFVAPPHRRRRGQDRPGRGARPPPQVRAAAADAAVRVSETILREEVKGEKGQDLVAQSLADVRAKLHS